MRTVLVLALLAAANGSADAGPRRGALRLPGRRSPADASTSTLDSIRLRADHLSRVARLRGAGDDEVVTHAEDRIAAEAGDALAAIERLQASPDGLDPVAEIRAVSAVSRMFRVGAAATPAVIDAGLRDRLERALSRALYRRRVARHETAVELEMAMNPSILGALTTDDGTLAPVLTAGRPTPDALVARAGGRDPNAIRWDELDGAERLAILRSQSVEQDFSTDRRIVGTKFRREWSKPRLGRVELGGAVARRGARHVSVDGVVMDRVEHLGPTTVRDVGGVEAHVRMPGPADQTARTAFEVARYLGSQVQAAHQHIPELDPLRARRAHEPRERFAFVDFYRRANLAADLRAVADGSALTATSAVLTRADGRKVHTVFFDYLKAASLGRIYDHIGALAKGHRTPLAHDSLKMAMVGFRTGELVGDPRKIDLEYRDVHAGRVFSPEGERLARALQTAILTEHYGIARGAYAAWYGRTIAADDVGPGPRAALERAALEKLHYNRPIRALLADAPSVLADALTPEVRAILEARAEEAYGVKMLVHDWSREPALDGNRAGLDRVVAAQRAGLARLTSRDGGTMSAHLVTQWFVRESGLLPLVERSIGMDEPAAAAMRRRR